ncbi:sigma-70 family RNA polymerase sigma factor [Novosphingobium aquimarinum]|uniref:sigma-70 family RNA polymerase sigma factor n=1 Tax=Novosphingobium aquimarinum TaxID=2682494 RepID=UPI002FC32726
MIKAQAGDRKSYAVLLSECNKWLTRYFSGRIAPGLVDDLVQEVLMAVHRKRASYDPARPFLPWLAAIARYRWIDYLRSHYRDHTEELFDDSAIEKSGDEAVMARISLERLFGSLSPAQVVAIERVKIEGQSIRDVASATGQSESAVKVHIHRGLKKLSTLVEKAD